MNVYVNKIRNRILYYYSSGSPLRYGRKLLYLKHVASFFARKRIADSLANDSKTQAGLRELEESGFLPLGPNESSLYPELEKAANERIKSNVSAKPFASRDYFGQLLQAEDFKTESIFVRFALQEEYLKLASTYFGHVPKLLTVSLLQSKPTEGDWTESQLWHRDYDDSRILKIFVYFTDVTSAKNGPFTYIPAKISKTVKNEFIPRRISDAAMAENGGASHGKAVLGTKGTTFMIDTARCYHQGSRCKDSIRVAYLATFTSMAPLYPALSKIDASTTLSPLEALAVGD